MFQREKVMKRMDLNKKSLTIFLAMTLAMASLSGCGKDDSSNSDVNFADIAGTNQSQQTQEQPSVDETTEEIETPVEETREGMYRSEITNEWIDESLQNQRPIAVMVDNEKKALPHFGLTEADVVYEMMNSTQNGRVTRLMAIVKDWGKITQFGSIRSTRPTNVMLAGEWNAVLCHDGGPYHIDAYIAKPYNNNFSGGFSRVKNGKPTEFTYPGLNLGDRDDSFSCTEIQLPFPHNSSTLRYNESTGTYDYYEYGQAHQDPQHNNAQLTFKNLLIQNCSFNQLDPNGYMIYNVVDNPNNNPNVCVGY